MRHELGLHTKEEHGQAIDLVMKAHARGVDAARGGDRSGVTFEIGFIHAIMTLAKLEGARQVEEIALRKRNDLDRRVMEIA